MYQLYYDIAKILLILSDMLYSKKRLEELETARAKLKIIIMNGGAEKAIQPIIPHIIKFANVKKKEILTKNITAFNYKPVVENNDYNDLFNKIPQLAGEYLNLFNIEEQEAFWKQINALIAKAVKIAII